jgi:hypothetical protein
LAFHWAALTADWQALAWFAQWALAWFAQWALAWFAQWALAWFAQWALGLEPGFGLRGQGMRVYLWVAFGVSSVGFSI